jgi:phosphoglycolate phosphatase-like HAD superfamily hydrolase
MAATKDTGRLNELLLPPAYQSGGDLVEAGVIAAITDLVDLATSSDDVEESKPAPDLFEVVLKKLEIEGAVAIGDTPYDATAASKAKIATVGVLCGGFTEDSLRQAGCLEIYPGPAALFACFETCLLTR